jgi:hypothetical protein
MRYNRKKTLTCKQNKRLPKQLLINQHIFVVKSWVFESSTSRRDCGELKAKEEYFVMEKTPKRKVSERRTTHECITHKNGHPATRPFIKILTLTTTVHEHGQTQ